MARQKPPDPPGDDVPGWVMTFSDVITLLMTFFILLLTFATNQPETFDRVQVAMFGGGGSRGFVSDAEGMTKDAVLMRQRSRAGRIFREGTETPPIYSDPELTTMANGIAGLEENEYRELLTTHRIAADLARFIDADNQITSAGNQKLRMLAIQLKKLPLQLDLAVHDEASLSRALTLAEHLTKTNQVTETQVGVAISPHQVQPGQLLVILAKQGADRGAKD